MGTTANTTAGHSAIRGVGSQRPYFSIVIPAYNRELEIQRAIDSCLTQSLVDFEIIVVDDASTDATAGVVRAIQDDRIRLVELAQNVGECPARNKGVDAASGEWIVWLDSDHELLPNALQRLRDAASNAPLEIGRVGFMCCFDDGRISPFPPPTGQVMDYLDHIRWHEQSTTSDLVMATRRSSFSVCRMPESRVAPMLYHLDFAMRFKEQWIPEILVLQHTDSLNRLSTGYCGAEKNKRRRRAGDDLKNAEMIMAAHGSALREHAPYIIEAIERERAGAYVITGPWRRGVAKAFAHLTRFPRSLMSWGILGLSVCGPDAFLFAKQWRHRLVDASIRRRCRSLTAGIEMGNGLKSSKRLSAA